MPLPGFERLPRPPVAAAIVFVIAVLATASIVWRLEDHRLKEARAQVANLASDHAQALHAAIDRALSASYALAALVRQGNGSIGDFESVATEMLPFYPGVAALSLAPGGVIREAIPRDLGSRVIGQDLLNNPATRKEAAIARDTGKLTLAGPFTLLEGRLGAVGRLPVFLDDSRGKPYFWGFTNVVIYFPEVLVGARFPLLVERGIDYELWRIHPDSGQKQTIAASASKPLAAPIDINIELPYGNWVLSAAPARGWGDPLRLSLGLGLGLAFSLLLAYAAKLLVESKTREKLLEAEIGERRRAEESLRETAFQMRQAQDVARLGFFVYSIAGDAWTSSPVLDDIFGIGADYPRNAEGWGRLIHPAERKDMLVYLRGVIAQRRCFDREYRIVRLCDGAERWVHGLGELELDDQGAPLRMLGTTQDVTGRKQAEQLLAASELRLNTIIETEPEGVLLLTADGSLVQINRAGLGMFDAESTEQVVGRSLQDAIREEYREAFAALVGGVFAGESGKLEFEIGSRLGRYRWLEMHAAPLRDPQGKVTALLGVALDITERKAAEQELRIAATAFESQECMFITDARNVILRVNRAFTDITGYTAADAVGRTPSLLNSGHHDALFYRQMWEVLGRDKYWEGEIWNRRKNGEVFPEWLAITAVLDEHGAVTNYVATFSDITARKAAEGEIRRLAFYDPLTELPNRRLLLDRLHQTLAASARSQRYGALLFVDLDDFKTLNDTLGHDKGDLLLQQVARRLINCVREGDTVARLGGDEFIVMLENLSDERDEAANVAEAVGEKIVAALNQPYRFAGYEHTSTPSIGVTLFRGRESSVDDLLKQADLAMYEAKAAGRNTLRFFDPEMQTVVTARAALEADLRQGSQQDEFVLHYQAQVDAVGRVVGAEALVRWQHPRRGLVAPDDFIGLAEETGLILPIGGWVVEAACARLAHWATRPETAPLTLAVNVSARQFRHPDFVAQVLAALDHSGAEPHRLKLELTETLLLDDVEDIIVKMTALKARGVGFSLDDFGTGYSSLFYLKRLPLDQLKIDQSFVRDVLTDTSDAMIVRTILALGESLGLAVIAEGVETAAQRDFLARQGCRAYQGYFFGRPMPADDFERLLVPARTEA